MAIEDTVHPNLSGHSLTIAVGAPLSGMAASLGREMVQAIQIATEDANQRGGVWGAQVTLVVYDDAGDVQQGEAVARKMCKERNLLAVVGHYNSNVTLATSLIYNAEHVTMISPIVSNPDLTERGLANVFRFTNRDDETGTAIARHLRQERGKQRVVIVGTTTTYGRSMSTAFRHAFEAYGGDVVKEVWVEEGTKQFDHIAQAMPHDSDLVFYGGTFEGSPLLKSLRAARRYELFATGDGCWDVENFLEPAGLTATEGEGVLVLSATPELGRADGSLGFKRRYESRYGRIGNYAVNSYDTTNLLVASIRDACTMINGLPQREMIAEALRSSSFHGIAYRSQIHWNAKGDNLSAITALYEVGPEGFRQVAEYPRSDVAKSSSTPDQQSSDSE